MSKETIQYQKNIGKTGMMIVDGWVVEVEVAAHRCVFGRHDYHVSQLPLSPLSKAVKKCRRWVAADRVNF